MVADRFLNTGLDASPVEGFLSMRVEGIVIAGEPDTDLAVPASMPLVVAGGASPSPCGHGRERRPHRGAIAAEHLLDLGHRRIGFVGARSAASDERRAGLEARVAAAAPGASVVSAVLPGEPTEEAGVRAVGALLDEHPDVTAVFAANDVMAIGALSGLAERGLRVPEDVSVIGYDDTRSRRVGTSA